MKCQTNKQTWKNGEAQNKYEAEEVASKNTWRKPGLLLSILCLWSVLWPDAVENVRNAEGWTRDTR